MSIPRSLCWLVLVVMATSPATANGKKKAASQEPITMMEVIPFSESDSGAQSLVETKCDLGRILAESIKEEATRRGIAITIGSETDGVSGRVLEMEIEGAIGRRGGAMTGTKSMTVRGSLRDGDLVIGSFTARRQQTALTSGTCKAHSHNSKKIAEDIGKWLKNPVMRARLGSA